MLKEWKQIMGQFVETELLANCCKFQKCRLDYMLLLKT